MEKRWLLNTKNVEQHPGAWATVMYDAVNQMLLVCEHLLHWRALTWPHDPETHDGGWCDAVCRFIERFADPERIQIPDLYRDRFAQVSFGLAYDVDALLHYWEAHPDALTGSAIQAWLAQAALAPLSPDWATRQLDPAAPAEALSSAAALVTVVTAPAPPEEPASQSPPPPKRKTPRRRNAGV
jgi:hypothetical protein